MNTFVTLYSFTYPSELVAIKGRLEAEGIECYVKDELTIQVHNFYSNAIGGIRLQVKEKDYARAKDILIGTGYITEEKQEHNFWLKFNDFTKNIPFIKNLRVELRLILLVGLVLSLVIFAILGILSQHYKSPVQTTYEYMTNHNWCLSHISYNGKNYAPNTLTDDELIFAISGNCYETIDFLETGRILIPGFQSKGISGTWELSNDRLIISDLDTLSTIFSNTYHIKKEPRSLILESKTITIYCHNEFY